MSVPRLSHDKAQSQSPDWQRHVIGVLGIALILGVPVFYFWPPDSPTWRAFPEAAAQLESACWRMGPLCVLLWLAYAEIQRIPLWFWGAGPLSLLLIWKRPYWLVFLIPLAIVIALLKPRKPNRRRG
ncbi:MAG: hypothetical protein ACLQNE_12190 [Thermoguttaceae bacterium]|jgi:hypothetical protein